MASVGHLSQSNVREWIHQIDNTEKCISLHQFLCMKLVVSQMYGGEDQMFTLHHTDHVKKLLNLFNFLKTEAKSPEKALSMIVDLLRSFGLQQCVKMLSDDYPVVDIQWNEGASFARFFSAIYCAFDDLERVKFRAKLRCLLNQKNDSTEEDLLKYVVSNNGDTELVRKAVINMKLSRSSKKIVKKIFDDNKFELYFPENPSCCFSSCLAVLFLLATPFIAFVVLISQLPESYSSSLTTQDDVVAAVRIDPFWYNSIGISGSGVTVAAPQSCSHLNTETTSVNGSSSPALNRTGNVPIQLLWEHGYLVRGSSLNLTVTITNPPSNGVAPVLYQLNNWDQYNKVLLTSSSPSHYIARYPLNMISTTITVDVNIDDAYLFLLYLPARAVFQYEFWLDKVYYSPDDYNFTCTSPCQFSLPSSYILGSNMQCILMLQSSGDMFFDTSTMANRNGFNVPFHIPALVVLLALLISVFISICIFIKYYCVYKKDSNLIYSIENNVV